MEEKRVRRFLQLRSRWQISVPAHRDPSVCRDFIRHWMFVYK